MRCYKCKQDKDSSEFYTRTGPGIRGRSCFDDYCKSCRRARSLVYTRQKASRMVSNTQAWKKANAERVREYDRKHYKEAHVKDWKINNVHLRRARIAGVANEHITLSALYARDAGICALCQCSVAREHASIDHKKCISNGGTHTWDNVQLAHRTCNVQRGTKSVFKGFRHD